MAIKINSVLLEKVNYISSLYNYVFRSDGKLFVYNTLRGTFLQIKPTAEQNYEWLGTSTMTIQNFFPEVFKKNWMSLSQTLRGAMLEGGFVIPFDFDERAFLSEKNKAARTRKDYFSYTILVVRGCNMNCSYCYEGAPFLKGAMSPEIQGKLIAQTERLLQQGTRSLDVTWYGGEPMVGYSIVCHLSESFLKLCRDYKAHYSAGIITNGTLLTLEKAKRLKELSVHFAQITLDGPPFIHDQRRPLKKGPSFDIILKNVKAICETIHVNIRCNVDKENVSHVKSLVDLLAKEGLSGKIGIHFAPVHGTLHSTRGDTVMEKIPCCNGYSFLTFAPIESELTEYAVSKGFGRPNLPEQKENACMADRQNSLVVDADGSLLKCWEFVGNKSEKVGILEEGWRVDEKGIYGLSHDPFSHELCKQCKVLPLCMGWCPIRVRCLPTKDSCNVIRFNLKKKLLHYYLTQQKQKGGAYGVQSSSPFAGDQSVSG